MIIPQCYYYKSIKDKFNYELLYIIYFVLVISKFIPRRSLWKQEKCFSLGAIFSKVQRLPGRYRARFILHSFCTAVFCSHNPSFNRKDDL